MKHFKNTSILRVTLFFIFAILVQQPAFAQDITGLWKGTITTTGSSLYYELVVTNQHDNKYEGYALTVYVDKGVENMGIKSAEIKKKGNKVVFEDDKLVYNNFTTPPKRVKLFASMALEVNGNLMTLKGTFNTRSLDLRYAETFSGTIQLQKEAATVTSKLIAKLDELKINGQETVAKAPDKEIENKKAATEIAKATVTAPPIKEEETKATTTVNTAVKAVAKPVIPDTTADKAEALALLEQKPKVQQAPVQKGKETFLPVVKNNPAPKNKFVGPAADLAIRKTEVINNIRFASDSLVLSLYDNGEIDGDTVSLVLNGKVILPRQGLTANAIKYTIQLTPQMGDSLSLVMYAENLGKIHPNTGLLILQDGANRHEIRFSGDMQKSPLIILRRKE